MDDCVAKYLWMRQMLEGVARAKREGKPVPKSIEDMEQSLGACPVPHHCVVYPHNCTC